MQALFGLRTDLDLNVGLRYSMSAAIFYPGFICGAYPAIVLAQRYPIERVIFGIVLLWGICLMSTAGCTTYQVRGSCKADHVLSVLITYQGLYVQRFFLGALESGVSPGWMLVVGGRLCKLLKQRSSLTRLHRMVQKTRTSIPHGSLVQHDCEILL